MQRAPRTQRTLLTRSSHKSPLLHVETSSTRTSTGARAPLTSPTAPCVPLLSPHARQRSAWAPVSPESPTGLFAFISCSLLCSVSPAHPQGQLLSPCQDASRAPPLAAADAGLLRASCRAGLGEEGREGAKLLEPPRRDARPRLCRPRGHRSIQASGQVPAPFSRLPLKFFSPGSGRCILPLQRTRAQPRGGGHQPGQPSAWPQ